MRNVQLHHSFFVQYYILKFYNYLIYYCCLTSDNIHIFLEVFMLKVKTAPMELRGISSKISGKGKMYYTLNVESEDGSPHALYCPSADALPAGLKKADMIVCTCEVTKFGKEEKLVVTQVERAEQ